MKRKRLWDTHETSHRAADSNPSKKIVPLGSPQIKEIKVVTEINSKRISIVKCIRPDSTHTIDSTDVQNLYK